MQRSLEKKTVPCPAVLFSIQTFQQTCRFLLSHCRLQICATGIYKPLCPVKVHFAVDRNQSKQLALTEGRTLTLAIPASNITTPMNCKKRTRSPLDHRYSSILETILCVLSIDRADWRSVWRTQKVGSDGNLHIYSNAFAGKGFGGRTLRLRKFKWWSARTPPTLYEYDGSCLE